MTNSRSTFWQPVAAEPVGSSPPGVPGGGGVCDPPPRAAPPPPPPPAGPRGGARPPGPGEPGPDAVGRGEVSLGRGGGVRGQKETRPTQVWPSPTRTARARNESLPVRLACRESTVNEPLSPRVVKTSETTRRPSWKRLTRHC